MAVRPIDEKIVAMKMDNSDFMRKATETTSIFGKLKDALNRIPGVDLGKVTQQFGGMQTAAGDADLSVGKLSTTADMVASRFSNLQVIAITALANITNKAVDAGLRIAKSITVDPVADGFKEYELKMGSIGTMLANTEWAGSTLGDVKKTLGDLNDYADKTIYNFAQMTQNIGRFTAAGVTLEDSATAIKGLGNLAAISGSDVNQLNTAMYQMSQALAAGKLNLMDWNSMVNAGMGGKKTQDALVATAKAMGKNVDLSDGFRNSISDGWLTSEVFLETLKKFGKDKSMTEAATKVRTFTQMIDTLQEGVGSGWGETWELIFGDFEEATELWSGFSNMIGGFLQKGADARNKFVGKIADAGIFKGFFSIILNTGEAIFKIFDAITKGIGKAFGGTNTGFLDAFGKGLQKFASWLTPSETMLKAITFLFQALATPIRIVFDLLVGLGKIIIKALILPFKLIGWVLYNLAQFIGYLGYLVISLVDVIKHSNIFKSAMNGLRKMFSSFGSVVDGITRAFSIFGDGVKQAFSVLTKGKFTSGPLAEDSKIVNKLFRIRDAAKDVGKGVKQAWDILTKGEFNGGPLEEDSKIVDKLFRIREAAEDMGAGVRQAWKILTRGDFTGGPLEEDSKIVNRLFRIREVALDMVAGVKQAWNILVKGDFTGGPWEEDSVIVDKLFRIRETVQSIVPAIKQAWNILTKGEFTGGPWEEDSIIVDALFKMRTAALDFASGVRQAWDILVKGKFTGGPWEEDSVIVDKLFKVREAVESFVAGVKQTWSILTKGAFIGGPWEEDSKIVDFIFKIREGVVKLGDTLSSIAPGMYEAWNIIFGGRFTGKGPWEEDSKIVDFLFNIRAGAQDVKGAFTEMWGILAGGVFSGRGPWEEDSAMVDFLFSIREGVIDLGKTFTDVGGAMAESWSLLTTGVFTGKGPWDEDSKIVGWLRKIGDGFKAIGEYISSIEISFQPVVNAFKSFFKAIGKGFEWVKDKLSGVGEAIGKLMPSGNTLFAGGFIAGLTAIVALAVKMAWDLHKVFTGWGKIGNGVSEALEGVGDALNAFSWQVRAQTLITIAIGVGLLAASLFLISRLPVDKITSGLIAIMTIMSALIGALAIMDKYDITGTGIKSAVTMAVMGVAVLIMAGAVKKLGELDLDVIGKGILGLVGIMGSLAGAMVLMSKFGGAKVGASALQFLAIAAAMHILLSVVEKLGSINPDVLTQGVIALGFILIELGAFFKLAGKTNFGIGATLGMLAVGKAVMNITEAVKEIGAMDVDILKTGLTTIAYILTAIALFAAITGKTGLFAAGAGMLLISAALTALIGPIAILGNMSMETLAKGLGAIAIVLLAIGGASMLMKGMIASGIGLMLVAAGLTSLLVPITAFGLMSWGVLIKGLVGLAGTLLIIGGAALLLSPAIIPLLLFGVGLGLLGTAMLFAALGMSLFSTALVTLATLSSASITTIVATMTMLVMGMGSLIPMVVDFIGKVIIKVVEAVGRGVPVIAEVFVKMLVRIIEVIGEYVPKIVTALVKIITNFLDALAENLPKIVDSAANLIVAFVESLAAAVEANGPKFISAVMRLMAEVTILIVQAGVAVVQALFGWIPGVMDATENIGETAEKTIREAFNAQGAAEDKGDEFAKGLDGKKGAAEKAGANVGKSAEKGTDSVNLSTVGSGHGSDFATALGNKATAASTSGKNIAESGKAGAAQVNMKITGENFSEGFASGIESQSVLTKIGNAAKRIASKAAETVRGWLDIHSPSRVAEKDGGFFGEGLAVGILNMVGRVKNSAKQLALTAKNSLNQFLDGFELPDGDNELHFKAVVDYEKLDVSQFGNPTVAIKPDTSLTNGLITATKLDRYRSSVYRQNEDKTPNTDRETSEQTTKQPAIIQVVTPERRELARWLVDDITDFQDFNLGRKAQYE